MTKEFDSLIKDLSELVENKGYVLKTTKPLTDDYGRGTGRFPTGRPVTQDGRLVYVPWVIGDKAGHEFFLDEQKLGEITLEAAMAEYQKLGIVAADH